MKRSELIKLSLGGSLLLAIFIMGGCKKEPVVEQIAPVSITGNAGAATGIQSVDSAVFFKGYFDGEPIKFEGNAYPYNAFIDPDSASHQGSGNDQPDNDAFYQSGSKWVAFQSGMVTTNASLELRSLAVRVFVSPINSISTDYYNLLGPAIYPVADDDGSGNGAYITLHDQNGVLWTSYGDQDGSNMVILSRGPNMNSYTVVTGIVTAKMYDSHGNMKKLTSASFTAALGI